MRNAESRTTCEACSKARPTLDVSEPRSAWVPFRARFYGARGGGGAASRSFSGRTFERGRSVALYGRLITVCDSFDVSLAAREAEQRLRPITLPSASEGRCAHIVCAAPFERGAR